MGATAAKRVALIEAGSPGLHIYSHVAMGRGVPMLATVLRDAGYDVRAFVEDISGKGSVDWDWVSRAGVIGFSAITCTLTRTAELVREARRVNPTAVIVLGGPEPTCAPERAFEAGADFVIRGEAELSLPRFVAAARRGLSAENLRDEVRDVPGIAWRQDGKVRYGPPARQLTREEVCALPLMDMSLVAGSGECETGVVWRSRGCPERCAFCEVHEIWPRYVTRDEETSVEEMIRHQSGGRGVFLIDDNAAANKPSFKRFLRRAIERGYAHPLVVQLRADAVFDGAGRLDRELLRLLRDVSPATMVCIGVESADDADLEQADKHITARQMARALAAIRRRGLLVHGMFIAFAGDTAEALRRNGRFARDHVTSLQYLFETPLPGTKSTAEHEAAGRVLYDKIADLRFLDGMHVAIRPEMLSPREMQAAVVAEYRRFYSRARVAKAFLAGLFLRYRRLGPGLSAHLRGLPPAARVREWFWLHLQFKFAPWALLRVGRERIDEFLNDAEYSEYLTRLEG
jgi:radical SAM superfamily enzyme YgiQ (UPF0313 family)